MNCYVRQENEMSEWQPIETAPRDETWILLTGGIIDYGWHNGDKPPVVVGQSAKEGWQFAWYDGGYYGEYENPTHWMPLPLLLPSNA